MYGIRTNTLQAQGLSLYDRCLRSCRQTVVLNKFIKWMSELHIETDLKNKNKKPFLAGEMFSKFKVPEVSHP